MTDQRTILTLADRVALYSVGDVAGVAALKPHVLAVLPAVTTEFFAKHVATPYFVPVLESMIRPAYAIEARHIAVVFNGAFDGRYVESADRMIADYSALQVSARTHLLFVNILLNHLTRRLAKPRFWSGRPDAEALELATRVLGFDISTISAAEATRLLQGEAARRAGVEAAIQRFDESIKEAIGVLKSAADVCSATSGQLGEVVEATNQRTSEATTLASDNLAGVSQVAAVVGRLASSIGSITEEAKRGDTLSANAVAAIDRSRQSIDQLERITDTIGSMVGMISEPPAPPTRSAVG